jgi:hypothetical protein
MKRLLIMIAFLVLSGCKSGELFPKGYGHELAYKCHIDPYAPDCLNPPSAIKLP